MKFYDLLNILKKEDPLTFEKFIFNSAIKSCDFIYKPTDDKAYNERHLFECLIFSSIMHIIAVELSNPSKFQTIKLSICKNLKELIRASEPIDNFGESRFELSFFEKYDIIEKEIAALGNNKEKLPILVLGMLYDIPLFEYITQLDEFTGLFNMETKDNQMIKLNNYLSIMRTSIIPKIKIHWR